MTKINPFAILLALTLILFQASFVETSSLESMIRADTKSTRTYDCTAVTQIPQAECEALVAIDVASSGNALPADWFSNTTPCDWSRVTCESSHVVQLSLQSTQLSDIPPEIESLSHLNWLSFYNNQLTELPAEIGSLGNLDTLWLSYNQLTELPAEIGTLTSLTRLEISNNQLTDLPPGFGNLTNLTRLELSDNQLTGLPAEFGNLTNLDRLEVSNNELAELPPEFGNLTNLFWLWLDGNQLAELPPEFGSLTNVYLLYLHTNQLTELPAELGGLTNLDSLYLYSNQLTSLPVEISSLTSLRSLSLKDNRLTELPAEIGNLTNLGSLNLENNQLSQLPTEIENLASLAWLYLDNNHLTGLPDSIVNLTALNALGLANNPLCVVTENTDLQSWLDGYGVAYEICPEWTVMVYLNGDNNLDSQMRRLFNELEQAVYQNPSLKIRVLWDEIGEGNTMLYQVLPDNNSFDLANYISGTSKWVPDWGDGAEAELDMGDPTTLYNFINHTRTAFPSGSHFLSIVDHGGGWSPELPVGQPPSSRWKAGGGGLSWDETSGFTYLSTQDLEGVFSSFEDDPLDLVFFDACFMATLEDGYAVRNGIDLLIASQNETWTTFPYDKYFVGIEELSSLGLAIQIADQYDASFGTISWARTISVIDTGAINSVITELNAFSSALYDEIDLPDNRGLVTQAYVDAQKFDNNFDYAISADEAVVDLYDFVGNIAVQFSGTDSVTTSAQALQTKIDELILYERHQSGTTGPGSAFMDLENAHGLSLYAPFGGGSDPTETYPDLHYYDDVIGGQHLVGSSRDAYWDEVIFKQLLLDQSPGPGPGGDGGLPPQPIDPPDVPPTAVQSVEQVASPSALWKPILLGFAILAVLTVWKLDRPID